MRGGVGRSGASLLAPVAGVLAFAGALVVVVLAIVTLGLALLWPGAKRRVFRFGAPGPRGRVRGATAESLPGDAHENPERAKKPR
jgi:hypothetical protein